MSSREHDGLAASGLPAALPDAEDSHWTRGTRTGRGGLALDAEGLALGAGDSHWTRQVDIRTLARMSVEVALRDSAPPPVYQRIAPAAAQMHAAGRSVSAIAQHFRVDDHTAAKALRWFSGA